VDPSLTTVIETRVTGEFAQMNTRASIDRWMIDSMLSPSLRAGMAISSSMVPGIFRL
jgi:hypothetical protein